MFALRRPAAWVATRRGSYSAVAGGVGPLRWGRRRAPTSRGLFGCSGQRRMAPWAGGSAGLHRPAVSQGHGGGRQCMVPSARAGARLLRPSAQQGNGGKGPQQRPAARGFFGRWQRGAKLASIDGGCRVRGSGQARVRDANISWAVGFGHWPVAQGLV